MVSLKQVLFFFGLLICTTIISCDEAQMDNTLEGIPYQPQPYTISLPDYFPPMPIPSDNPTTLDGIQLGRHLFYDNILSGNGTMSCSSCHDPKKSFTDGFATSKGIDGIAGRRSSMSLVNTGFTKNGLFWDGRAATLEDQALLPVVDPIELHTTWPEVEDRLKKHKDFPALFRKAFGIKTKDEITKELAAKALAQFQRIIISSNSKYDLVKQGKAKFTDLELMGFNLFTDQVGDDLPDAECHHCHQLDLATADNYFNNGLQFAPALTDFKDMGRGAITSQIADNGKMRAPTLRNVLLTAPFMHDGSLATIEDVLNHYDSRGKQSPNKDPLIRDLHLEEEHKLAIIAFLATLVDTSYLKNPLVLKPE